MRSDLRHIPPKHLTERRAHLLAALAIGLLLLMLAAPSPALAFRFLSQWGGAGGGAGQFNSPLALSVWPEGDAASAFVYVADTNNSRIVKGTRNGYVSSWTTTPQVAGPRAIAHAKSGTTLYVGNTGSQRVEMFSDSGSDLGGWNAPSGSGGIRGIDTDSTGAVYVATVTFAFPGTVTVSKYSSTGSPITSWTAATGASVNVNGLAVDSANNVYVVLSNASPNVKKYNSSGTQVGSFVAGGTPLGIDVDHNGFIYIANLSDNRIDRYLSSGTFADSIGTAGSGDGQLNQPVDVDAGRAANSSWADAWVLDGGNSRIEVFTELAKLSIQKDALPNDSQDFSFTTSGGLSPSTFSLDDDSDLTLSNTQVYDYEVPRSAISVSEGSPPAGWDFLNSSCNDGSSSSNIDLSANEIVTCTFNNRKRGAITIVKDVVPGTDPQDFSFTAGGGLSPTSFQLDDDSDPTLPNSQTFTNLPPGAGYSAAEVNPPSGWSTQNGQCSNGSVPSNITVDPGQTTICVFTNNKDGRILLVKDVQPGTDPQDFVVSLAYPGGTAGATLDDDPSDSTYPNVVGIPLPTGDGYAASETVPPGWAQSGASCDDGSPLSNISVSPDETVTCTFTNTNKGTIRVVKDTKPNDPQDFSFTAGGGLSPSSFQLDDDSDGTLSNTQTFSNVPPGSGYSVSETIPNGWTQTGATCSDGSPPSNINLSVGETVTCTFVNARPYPSPVGATPTRVSLVPAYQPCETTSVNSQHGAPLNFPSCNPPQLVSSTVTMGTSFSLGFVRAVVCPQNTTSAFCNPSPSGSLPLPDIRFTGSIRDVRCRQTAIPPGCMIGQDYNPNTATGPYANAGSGTASATPFCNPDGTSTSDCRAGTDLTILTPIPGGGPTFRITDGYNCDVPPANGQPGPACPASAGGDDYGATMADLPRSCGSTECLPLPMDCLPTANTSEGSGCGINTTANAITPGAVIPGKEAVWELGEIQVWDAGDDGVRGNVGDQLFAVQGYFVP